MLAMGRPIGTSWRGSSGQALPVADVDRGFGGAVHIVQFASWQLGKEALGQS